VQACACSKHERALAACCSAIRAVAAHEDDMRCALADVGGAEVLLQLCAHSSSDLVLAAAAGALRNISCSRSCSQTIVDANGITALSILCASSKHADVLAGTAGRTHGCRARGGGQAVGRRP
jgi:hypothetical protein